MLPVNDPIGGVVDDAHRLRLLGDVRGVPSGSVSLRPGELQPILGADFGNRFPEQPLVATLLV